MRILARRMGVGLALVFLWSSLAMAMPLPVHAPIHAKPVEMPAMVHHHADHAADLHSSHATPPPATMHHHGNGACCLAGQNCTMACNITLIVVSDNSIRRGVHIAPLAHPSAQPLTRAPQPPRRPPKA